MNRFDQAVPIFEFDRNGVECPQVFSYVRMSPLLVDGVENPDLLRLKYSLRWILYAPYGYDPCAVTSEFVSARYPRRRGIECASVEFLADLVMAWP